MFSIVPMHKVKKNNTFLNIYLNNFHIKYCMWNSLSRERFSEKCLHVLFLFYFKIHTAVFFKSFDIVWFVM